MTARELFANCIMHGSLILEICIQLHLITNGIQADVVGAGADPDIWDFVQLSEYLGHTSTSHRLRGLCS
jgi:hypothetical protein